MLQLSSVPGFVRLKENFEIFRKKVFKFPELYPISQILLNAATY